VSVSGVAAFRPLFDALSGMGFYNLNPDQTRELQPPDPGELLKRDGSNLASVLANLESRAPRQKVRIEEYLASCSMRIGTARRRSRRRSCGARGRPGAIERSV
jgi:hypothetical protein